MLETREERSLLIIKLGLGNVLWYRYGAVLQLFLSGTIEARHQTTGSYNSFTVHALDALKFKEEEGEALGSGIEAS